MSLIAAGRTTQRTHIEVTTTRTTTTGRTTRTVTTRIRPTHTVITTLTRITRTVTTTRTRTPLIDSETTIPVAEATSESGSGSVGFDSAR